MKKMRGKRAKNAKYFPYKIITRTFLLKKYGLLQIIL